MYSLNRSNINPLSGDFIEILYLPPTTISVVTSNSSIVGAICQCARCSALVSTSNTSCCGALNSRMITKVSSVVVFINDQHLFSRKLLYL